MNKQYVPVDKKRVRSVLQNAYSCLALSKIKDEEKRDLQTTLKEVMEKLQVPLPDSRQATTAQQRVSKTPKPR